MTMVAYESNRLVSDTFFSSFLPSITHKMPQGYFRSKLFVLPSTANPLVAAAGPILSLLERFGITDALPPIQQMRDNIEHELHAFHSHLASHHYVDELIALAHYILTATIDELLGKNYLRVFGKVAKFVAFTPSSFDEKGPQTRFFEVVDFLQNSPRQYLDIIELAYFCLIAGFEGEQHGRVDARQTLDNLIENLYQLIHQHRVHKLHFLFNFCKKWQTGYNHSKLIGIMGACVLGMIGLMSFAGNILIEQKAKTMLLEHALFSQRIMHG